MALSAVYIEIRGLVQGVGFRPFIHRLATEHAINGWVDNRADCVSIHAQGRQEDISTFISDIRKKKPLAADIHSIRSVDTDPGQHDSFRIERSRDGESPEDITEVSPDIAVCDACVADMRTQSHRIDYPYINCTNCGPRFSIVRDLPYDRDKTTMEPFPMCDQCRSEYENILDRRFHAQPVACNHCGPSYTLNTPGRDPIKGIEDIIGQLAGILRSGGIVALKGMGGYNLVCDAGNEDSVLRLRNVKNRESKPFAVMFRSADSAREYLDLDSPSIAALESWRRPILLARTTKELAASVNNGFFATGAMLPALPLHYLLWEKLQLPALVFTSGNLSDEPIVIDDEEAVNTFLPHVDAVLTGDRDIHNRCDDSVTMQFQGESLVIRRARGYAPSPTRLGFDVDGIFAAGAELVNCFAIGRGEQAILSQHQGDLKNYETYAFYRESVERFSRLFRFRPKLAAVDLHPDYLSTRFAEELGVPLIRVQHHHAHIASVMAEHGVGTPVIGVSMDGTGLGADGHIWGAEFMTCDFKGFNRHAHFSYVPLPGGDQSVREPWRIAMSYLLQAYGDDGISEFRNLFPEIAEARASMVEQAIRKGINTPLSDSAGRLFDAVSALAGVCREAGFHAEAPMRLESAAAADQQSEYRADEEEIINFSPMIRQIVDDLKNGVSTAVIAARFHQTIAGVIHRKALDISEKTNIATVALSGGVFQNRILLSLLLEKLGSSGLSVLYHRRIPSSDGGLALGQLAVAAHQDI